MYRFALIAIVVLVTASPVLALQPRQAAARFDSLVIPDPSAGLARLGVPAHELPAGAQVRQGWEAFVAEQGGAGWSGWFDARSALPTLVQGKGVAWFTVREGVPQPSLPQLETLARNFITLHPQLLGRWSGQLQFDPAASGQLTDALWQITFRQVVDGVPVDGARYDFHVSRGNLVSFGAFNWAPVNRGATAQLTEQQARSALYDYLRLTSPDDVVELAPATLRLIPLDPRGQKTSVWDGAPGAGYAHALVWRFVLATPGEPATWIAEVDADTGLVIAFFDDTRYERIKGYVYPTSDDQICPTGCAQPDYPMPYADYTIDGGAVQYTGDHGLYECTTTGSTIRTTLAGPYIRVNDNCGAISQTTTCDDPLDLSTSAGTDCAVPPGSSPGNTHSARSSFYHLNRVMEKGRAFLPANNWLKAQLTDNVNINSTCNAYWSGSVNFYKSGGGCRNTGEIAAVFVHEWGHGIDQNDGGGYDNPSEAYADAVAFLDIHESCIGRGFFADNHSCDGYGNACLNCSGIRDQDWDMRANHTPSTAAGFIGNNCGGGGGPCGREEHCEGYLAGETLWDLAVRDLPASGLDQATAWQLSEKLFYKSRSGSGGSAYNCSVPNSDGCGTTTWFHKLRLIDDDDGNLDNGTPHAAAIFAAFDRHKIACGAASDASNQNHSSCPALAQPSIAVQASTNTATLSWNPVPNAASYTILRSDIGCERSQNIVATIAAPATSYADTDLSNDFTVYYRLQAVGANSACESAVSECISTAPQPLAGTVRFDQLTFGCSTRIAMRVTDGNVGASTTTVEVWSTTEPTPEIVTLTVTAPGGAKYAGGIFATSGPPVAGDGLISLAHGDAITVRYLDADDGLGGHNVPVIDHATGDCVYPVISQVRDTSVTDRAATLAWLTDEASSSAAVWGPTKPPATTTAGPGNVTSHQVTLGGLQQCTVYYYEVRSTDAAGNVATANNGGSYYHFETLGDFGQGLQPCHQGRVSLAKSILACTDSVQATLVDMDLNLDANAAETAPIMVSSTTEPTPELITLTETGPTTSTFRGAIPVAEGAPIAGDGVVQIGDGDTLTASYADADDGTGATAVSYATAIDDCRGSDFSSVRVTDVKDDSAIVRFTTVEPTTGLVQWGPTAALGFSKADSGLSTSHALTINPLAECGRIYFRVSATDAYGNTRVLDNHGVPFEFNAYLMPGFFRDTFESSSGWTLEGEWQIAAPQGRGSSPPDPSSAFEGAKVLGQDLTGLGPHLGDYEPYTTHRATSPTMDASGKSGVKLKFRRWLNTGNGAVAAIEVRSAGVWHSVWSSDSTAGLTESAWSLQTLDISQYADNNASLQISFKQFTGGPLLPTMSGWNIDRMIVKSSSQPDYEVCGACGGAPTFAGVQTARDVDACANNGVALTWSEAPAWGTGPTGTYSVYRGATPDFTPSASNRIATGLTGGAFTDAGAPNNATSYYLVRAENGETCSSGPNNGGVTDGNTSYAGVTTTSSRPLPGGIANLGVGIVNNANLRITWGAAADASSYRLYRSIDPRPGSFGQIKETGHLFSDDVGAGANRETYFYIVRAVNACGQETP